MQNLITKSTSLCVFLSCLPIGFISVSGCGTNFEDVLFQVASAAGRTAVDAFVTDVANAIAGVEDTDDSVTDVADDDSDNDDSGSTDLDSLVGDLANGEDIFMANNCGACHCVDGIGGCALDAPSVIGVSTQVTDEVLRGSHAHAGGKFNLSDQEIADLIAYIASL
ncbi:cytochrome c [bacterium AH-315-J04]|nr:cytochrome c [bacterium AH-315-J04]